MADSKITLVYATSPHRYGDSDVMIALSIATLKEFGFKDCPLIICADGINPDSHYNEDSKTAAYQSYLKKVKASFPEATLLASKKHLGLTKNYMQAWDKKKIKTEFCFMMNHDVALSPGFDRVPLKTILNTFPRKCKILFFPRDETDFWEKKWFRPVKDIKLPKSWSAARALGFQDNACILRKQTFPSYVKKYYDEKHSPYIEDTIHQQMASLDPEDLKGWESYGTFVWLKALSFHLDGQSKAGNGKKPEEVWSRGAVFPENIKKLREQLKNRNCSKSFRLQLGRFLDYEFRGHQQKVIQGMREFQTSLINFLAFAKADQKRANAESQKKEKTIEGAVLHWEPPLRGNYTVQLSYEGEVILYGGHALAHAEINYQKLQLKGEEMLECKFESYTESGERTGEYDSFKINLKTGRISLSAKYSGPRCALEFISNAEEDVLVEHEEVIDSLRLFQENLLSFWGDCEQSDIENNSPVERMNKEIGWWKTRINKI